MSSGLVLFFVLLGCALLLYFLHSATTESKSRKRNVHQLQRVHQLERAYKQDRRSIPIITTSIEQDEEEENSEYPSSENEYKHQPFYSSSVFDGRRPGYIFKMGHLGLGYYKDIIHKNVSFNENASMLSFSGEKPVSQMRTGNPSIGVSLIEDVL